MTWRGPTRRRDARAPAMASWTWRNRFPFPSLRYYFLNVDSRDSGAAKSHNKSKRIRGALTVPESEKHNNSKSDFEEFGRREIQSRDNRGIDDVIVGFGGDEANHVAVSAEVK